MLADIELVKVFSGGLVGMTTNGDRAMWSRAIARQPTRCAVSDKPIAPGDAVFRPIGNQSYRMLRVRADVVATMAEKLVPRLR